MIPLGLGVALLAAYGQGYMNWGAPLGRREEALTLRRLGQLRSQDMPWTKDALRFDKRVHGDERSQDDGPGSSR
jgi:hypothetical protein